MFLITQINFWTITPFSYVLSYIEHCNIQGLENNSKDIEPPSIARNRLLSKAELFKLDDIKYFLIIIYAKKNKGYTTF